MRKKSFFCLVLAILLVMPLSGAKAREDYFKPASGDILPAIGLEKAVTTAEGGINVYLANGDLAGGYPLFSDTEIFASAPLLSDIDGDGVKEIIAVTRNSANAYSLKAYRGDRTQVADFDLATEIYYDPIDLRIAGQAKRDVVLIDVTGKVYSYRFDTGIFTQDLLVDVGEPAGVSANSSGSELILNFPQKNKITVYIKNGGVWQFNRTINTDQSILFPVIYGPSGIVYGTGKNNQVIAWNKTDWNVISGFPITVAGSVVDGPVLADVDPDQPGVELIAQNSAGKSTITDLSGNSLATDIPEKSFVENSLNQSGQDNQGIFAALRDYAVSFYERLTTTVSSLFGQIKATAGASVGESKMIVALLPGTNINNGDSIDIGAVEATGFLEKVFSISNLGTGNLNLLGNPIVVISGANATEFSIVSNPDTTIPVNSSSTFVVKFSPITAGHKIAVLTIENNDSLENPFSINLSANASEAPFVYEDAENGDAAGWSLWAPNSPISGTFTNVADDAVHNRVIELNTNDINQQAFKLLKDNNTNWDNTEAKILKVDLKTTNDLYLYATVNTVANGRIYLMYSFNYPTGVFGQYYSLRLNPALKDGNWHTIVRDLQNDIASLNSVPVISRIENFMASGKMLRLDNIKLYKSYPVYFVSGKVSLSGGSGLSKIPVKITDETGYSLTANTNTNGLFYFPSLITGNYTVTPDTLDYSFTPASYPLTVSTTSYNNLNFSAAINNTVVYEDAEDGKTLGWNKWANSAISGSATNVDDATKSSKVVEIAVTDPNLQAMKLTKDDGANWSNTIGKTIEFDLKTNVETYIYANVDTNKGNKFVMYSFGFRTGIISNYYSLRLEQYLKDNTWRTVSRNLEKDLQTLDGGITLTKVNYFMVASTLSRLDNIKLTNNPTVYSVSGTVINSANGLPFPNAVLSIAPGNFTVKSGVDGKYTFNYLANNSAYIIAPNNFPGYDLSPTSTVVNIVGNNGVANFTAQSNGAIVYEDAEDGAIKGWNIWWPGSPVTGTATNIFDSEKNSRVIEINISDPNYQEYVLRTEAGGYWDNIVDKVLEWDMKTAKETYVYAFVNTSKGDRYVMYSFNFRTGIVGAYYSLRLDANFMDNQWHTIARNLESDIQSLEPGTTLNKIYYYMIGGQVRVDNIQTKKN